VPKFRVKFERDGENCFKDVEANNPSAAAAKLVQAERLSGNTVYVKTTKFIKEVAAE
jgi:hypothetical protein